jgi:hypothetical protein
VIPIAAFVVESALGSSRLRWFDEMGWVISKSSQNFEDGNRVKAALNLALCPLC